MTLMLPANCSDLGNLKDVFRSAERSLTGEENSLELQAVSSAVVILVDGLGSLNLSENSRIAPYMNSLAVGRETFCGFPSTTVCSITSFATGVSTSEHGLFGYRIFNRSTSESVNLLSGLDRYEMLDYFTSTPISQTSESNVFAVTKSEYRDTGLTQATMASAHHVYSDSLTERFESALDLVRANPSCLVYLYVPELDQCAHRYGVSSQQWKDLLSELDVAVRNFDLSLPQGVGAILTADHGVIDIDPGRHVYLDEYSEISEHILSFAGDPRAPYLYLKSPESIELVADAIESNFGSAIEVFSRERMVTERLWLDSLLQEDDLIPDLILIVRDDVAVFHRAFSKAKSMQMIGHHGSLSEREVRVPLLLLGSYSSSLLVP